MIDLFPILAITLLFFLQTPYGMRKWKKCKKIKKQNFSSYILRMECESKKNPVQERASCRNRVRLTRYWRYIEEPDSRTVLSVDSRSASSILKNLKRNFSCVHVFRSCTTSWRYCDLTFLSQSASRAHISSLMCSRVFQNFPKAFDRKSSMVKFTILAQ